MHTGACDNFYHSLLDQGAFRLAGGKRVGIFELSEHPQDVFHIFWAVHIEFLFWGANWKAPQECVSFTSVMNAISLCL